jgi:hypothetical protein
LETYSLWKAIASFIVAYITLALIFSFWFHACYLQGTNHYPFFDAGRIASPNWWDFVYFSFVTIATLGYGDISPLNPLPQALVILESIIGVLLVVVYLGIILQAAGRTRQLTDIRSKDNDS